MSTPVECPSRRACARRGFTLLEAMIAVMIVGLAAVAALSSFGTLLRTGERVRDALEANVLADQRVAVASLLSSDELAHLPDSVKQGQFAAPFERYTWHTSSRERHGERGLFDVSVSVRWRSGEYAIATRLYRPAPLLSATP